MKSERQIDYEPGHFGPEQLVEDELFLFPAEWHYPKQFIYYGMATTLSLYNIEPQLAVALRHLHDTAPGLPDYFTMPTFDHEQHRLLYGHWIRFLVWRSL